MSALAVAGRGTTAAALNAEGSNISFMASHASESSASSGPSKNEVVFKNRWVAEQLHEPAVRDESDRWLAPIEIRCGSDEKGFIGLLHISRCSQDYFDTTNGSLKFDRMEEEEDAILYPILSPSRGRSDCACLNLESSMEQNQYVHIVAVVSDELEAYKRNSPPRDYCLLELPKWASERGIGAARNCLLDLARKICHESFRFAFMLDDNVRAWKAIKVGDNDPFFYSLKSSPLEEDPLCDGPSPFHKGQRRDISLYRVLRHFQDELGRTDELRKIGMIGFNRIGKYSAARRAYARTQVYKAIIFNLDALPPGVNYNEEMRVWEDLEFNLRVSGQVRIEGADGLLEKTERMEEGFLKGKGLWMEKTGGSEPINKYLDADDLSGPAVVCKCYRFGYLQLQHLPGTIPISRPQPLSPAVKSGEN